MDPKPSSMTPEEQRSEAIVEHIEAERERLGENIRELRTHLGSTIHGAGERIGEVTDKAREAADWRAWLHKRPFLMFGLAFVAGFWLAFRRR